MKKVLLVILVLFVTSISYAQCVAEVKDVKQDEIRGSIIVETQYTLNGKVVQLGNTRYSDSSGTNAEIIAKAKEDIEIHCKNLIKRIDNNFTYLKTQKLIQQKALTAPIITDIKDDLIGEKKTVNEVTDTFKGKDIKVTYDEKNTITNTVLTP